MIKMAMTKTAPPLRAADAARGGRPGMMSRVKKALARDWQFYLLCLPALIYVFIFMYGPMYGIQIAFKDFKASSGIWGSPWVGLKHFIRFISAPNFFTILRNTLSISIYELIAGFPFPIIIALLLNQLGSLRFKKLVQTTIYAPHFISVVVMCGMITLFFSPSSGIVNYAIEALGGDSVYFLGKPELFQHLYVWTGVWQNTGWGTIIYISALSSISPDLYEAAKIDGANKLQTIFNVDIPCILPTVVMLLILNMGSFMNVGFQKAFLLQNPLNLDTSEIISTYVYKIGLVKSQFSYSTAISLFNTVINVILLVTTNKVSEKLSGTSLF